MDKNKKILILLIAIAIIIITLTIIFTAKNQNKKEETTIEKTETVDISSVLEIENIEKSKYKTTKNKNAEIASKYLVTDNIYELNANVEFEDTIGKMLYVREDNEKINVFQTEYKLDKYESINSQVEEIIRDFEEMCKSYLNISEEDKKATEILYGEPSQKEEIPLGESIYNDNRLYSKTYEKEEKIYDINFYRNGEKIICEFVYEV